MTLGHSGDSFVGLVGSMDLVTFWACHRAAFAHFGGVPRELLYDRTKTVVRTHVGRRLHAVLATQLPMPSIKPTSSASGMKPAGGTKPSSVAEQLVPARGTEALVDQAEAVEIHVQHRHLQVAARGPRDRVLEVPRKERRLGSPVKPVVPPASRM